MIHCVNYKSLKYYGDALISQYRLRYKLLVDGQYWEVPRFQGMEYDQYDTPAATYLVWMDENAVVRGSVRACPTDRPYMIKDLWPSMVTKRELPASNSVWEATRFCIDRKVDAATRLRIKHELVLAFLEFGLQNDIREMIGIMPLKLWESCFISSGWDIEYLGEETRTGESISIAGLMPISLKTLHNVRNTVGIATSVLFNFPNDPSMTNSPIILQAA